MPVPVDIYIRVVKAGYGMWQHCRLTIEPGK